MVHTGGMATFWYPKAFALRIPFHANFNVNAQATGLTYGLVAGQQASIARDAANVPLVVNFKDAAAAYAQAVTEWAAIILDGEIGAPFPPAPTAPTAPTFALGSETAIRPRTLLYGGIIKADPDYTLEVGEAYGIISPAEGPLATPAIQRATAQAGTDNVDLSLFKGGYDVIAIDMKRAGGGWVQIGVSQTANFKDTTASLVAGQPEVREYRCQGMLNNARTGELSATVSVVTVP
jgi:hypothetical protein